MRRNAVTNAAFMKEICKHAVTHIYWRKYHQSFPSTPEFREDGVWEVGGRGGSQHPLEHQVQMMNLFEVYNFAISTIFSPIIVGSSDCSYKELLLRIFNS